MIHPKIQKVLARLYPDENGHPAAKSYMEIGLTPQELNKIAKEYFQDERDYAIKQLIHAQKMLNLCK